MNMLQIHTSLWLSILLLRCLFAPDIVAALFMLEFFLRWGLALWGAAISIAWLVKGCSGSGSIKAFGLAFLSVGLSVLFVSTSHLDVLGIHFKFYRNLGRYQAVVEQMGEQASATKMERASSPDFKIDEGPPTRVAFSWYGFIDNWVGVVYDPSGEVERVNQLKKDGSNRGDLELGGIQKLFGGDLRRARKLKKHWYYCSFT